MAEAMNDFIEDLRREIARWKGELARLEGAANESYLKTADIKGWLETGERITAQHENRHA